MLDLNLQTCLIEELTRRCGTLYLDMSSKLRKPYWYGYISQAEASS
jgi:hypothetical protein